MNIKIPNYLIDAYNNELILGIIQFGSSIYNKTSKDIDVAVVVKEGKFSAFVDFIKNKKINKLWDISLIKEEEICYDNFFFGNHGIYLIEAFKYGNTLLGINPFINLPKHSEFDIKNSVYERLKEYLYILRKRYFKNGNNNEQFSRRYFKFLKLSAYLLDDKIKYPEVMRMSLDVIYEILEKKGLKLTENRSENMEIIWENLRKQY